MANRLPHLAIRVNGDPHDPSADVIATVNLAMDDPRNWQRRAQFCKLECEEDIVPVSLVTEAAGVNSPRARLQTGKGKLLRFNIGAWFYTGNQRKVSTMSEGEMGSCEADIDVIADAVSRPMTGFNDGYSRYLWVTPNYNWNEPAEQWIRCVPEADSFTPQYLAGHGMIVRGFTVTLLSDHNALDITRINYRRGFVYAGAGSILLTNGSIAVVGSGTHFKRDFIHLDWIEDANGVRLGRVESVADDTHLTLRENFVGTTGSISPYIVHQRNGHQTISVPIYTFTEFDAGFGYGITPYGTSYGG